MADVSLLRMSADQHHLCQTHAVARLLQRVGFVRVCDICLQRHRGGLTKTRHPLLKPRHLSRRAARHAKAGRTRYNSRRGGVAERFKAPVLKTCVTSAS